MSDTKFIFIMVSSGLALAALSLLPEIIFDPDGLFGSAIGWACCNMYWNIYQKIKDK